MKFVSWKLLLLLSAIQTYSINSKVLIPDNQNTTPLQYNLVNGLPNIFLTQESERIGQTWSNGQVWDKDLIQKFYSLLPHDNFFVVLDLGAQTGSFSLLAKYFPNSIWYSFEPINEAAAVLQQNLTINNIDNVLVQPMAAADFSGKVSLKLPRKDEWGLATIGSNVIRFDPVLERIVDCIDLDSFIISHTIQKVDFIKIDTEGAELKILKGAQKLLQRDRPIILMEYNQINMKQCGFLPEDINAFLISMDYSWELISSEDILCTPIS